ncbi:MULTISPECIES: hypothetical protein [unclassified Streptomyces]|uniref:hypothetical protein n=1 Tax=unclassified Streptomyces TaxID=2593676 RepID=UPI003410C5A0
MDTRLRDSDISEWLARSQQEPAQAWHEWSTDGGGVALLPLGHRFVAPRLPEALVYAAAGSVDLQEVTKYLTKALGPVIFDNRAMGGTYYALMQCQDGLVWEHEEIAPLLGHGTYLGVPRMDRRKPPGTYWVVPPRHAGHLCEVSAVDALVTLGSAAVQGAEPWPR